MKEIGFNKPYLTGKELEYITDAVVNKKLSGNGKYTQQCHEFFESNFGFSKCLLTTSCTDALEMCALLLGIQPGDEVIMPSFTFVSTANAFILRGAKVVFCDSNDKNPNLDPDEIEALITSQTKAIVVVHYAGIACDMDTIMDIAHRHKLYVVEDAAQAIDSYYKGRPLGGIGHLAAFSFHETKNISSGEGGMLVVNDKQFISRAEIIWEKGTNRAAFFKGLVDKYTWVDVGSSFLPSEIIAAFLYAQLEKLTEIQNRRREIFKTYFQALSKLQDKKLFKLPHIPEYATNNGHMFYMVCRSQDERDRLIEYLKSKGINTVFHYLSLHKSPFFHPSYQGGELINCDNYSDCIVRLPFYYELNNDEIDYVCKRIYKFVNRL